MKSFLRFAMNPLVKRKDEVSLSVWWLYLLIVCDFTLKLLLRCTMNHPLQQKDEVNMLDLVKWMWISIVGRQVVIRWAKVPARRFERWARGEVVSFSTPGVFLPLIYLLYYLLKIAMFWMFRRICYARGGILLVSMICSLLCCFVFPGVFVRMLCVRLRVRLWFLLVYSCCSLMGKLKKAFWHVLISYHVLKFYLWSVAACDLCLLVCECLIYRCYVHLLVLSTSKLRTAYKSIVSTILDIDNYSWNPLCITTLSIESNFTKLGGEPTVVPKVGEINRGILPMVCYCLRVISYFDIGENGTPYNGTFYLIVEMALCYNETFYLIAEKAVTVELIRYTLCGEALSKAEKAYTMQCFKMGGFGLLGLLILLHYGFATGLLWSGTMRLKKLMFVI